MPSRPRPDGILQVSLDLCLWSIVVLNVSNGARYDGAVNLDSVLARLTILGVTVWCVACGATTVDGPVPETAPASLSTTSTSPLTDVVGTTTTQPPVTQVPSLPATTSAADGPSGETTTTEATPTPTTTSTPKPTTTGVITLEPGEAPSNGFVSVEPDA